MFLISIVSQMMYICKYICLNRQYVNNTLITTISVTIFEHSQINVLELLIITTMTNCDFENIV